MRSAYKPLIVLIWLGLLLSFTAWVISLDAKLGTAHIVVRDMVEQHVLQAGIWGGVIYLLVYTLRPLILIPASLLTTLAGAVFGPWLGFFYAMLAETLAANFSFLLARYLKGERQWRVHHILEKIDSQVRAHGFLWILAARLSWVVPFDAVNYAVGLSSAKHRDFFWATLLGIVPGVIVFVSIGHLLIQGQTLTNQHWFGIILLSSLLMLVSLSVSHWLRRRQQFDIHLRH